MTEQPQCKMDRVLLEEYADGLLTKFEKVLVEEHVKGCTSCRKKLTEMKLLFWEIRELASEPVQIPQALSALGDKLVNEFVNKPFTIRERLGKALKLPAMALGSVKSLSSRLRLTKEVNQSEAKTKKRLPGFTRKVTERLWVSSRKFIKKQLVGLFGGKA